MGRLIVFELLEGAQEASAISYSYDGYKIRRLTDAEVEAKLVAATRTIAVDTDRARFVQECAMRLFLAIEGRVMAANMTEGEWESRRDEFASTAIADAEALAARLF